MAKGGAELGGRSSIAASGKAGGTHGIELGSYSGGPKSSIGAVSESQARPSLAVAERFATPSLVARNFDGGRRSAPPGPRPMEPVGKDIFNPDDDWRKRIAQALWLQGHPQEVTRGVLPVPIRRGALPTTPPKREIAIKTA